MGTCRPQRQLNRQIFRFIIVMLWGHGSNTDFRKPDITYNDFPCIFTARIQYQPKLVYPKSDGAVSPCCVDWIGGTNLGNIMEGNIKEIWNGEKMYQFRKMQLENRRCENESCKKCELVQNDYYTRDNIDGFPVENLR